MSALLFNKALVVGLGYRTGLATANFLAARGVQVTVTDQKAEPALKEIIQKLDPRVTVICGEQKPEIIDRGFDIVILSPGVPQSIPLIAYAKEKKIPVISEIELAYTFLKGSIIAITGTDGKSTTTTLTGHILEQLGMETFVGGNIGIPLISLVEKTTDRSITVIELSSFQLETIKTFKPDVAAILNVTPDHLDRYSGMDDYFAAKLRIAMNQTPQDYFVFNSDDKLIPHGLADIRSRWLTFSLEKGESDAFYADEKIFVQDNGARQEVVATDKMCILGKHNIQNAMAALLMVTAVLRKRNIPYEYAAIAEAIYSFKGLEHRMEVLGTFHNRTFINDSKATTVGAVEMAIKSLKESGILILGGRTKGDDYSRLITSLRDKIRGLVLVGESQDEFATIFHEFTCRKVKTFDEAVIQAMRLSLEGDAILLSPACASFDMFKSFEERGKVFKESFAKLTKGDLTWI